MKKLLLAGVAALSVLSASAAHAAYDECAVVLETPDGFLALREDPTPRSKLILKLHRGDILDVDKTMTNGIHSEKITDWTWVIPFNIDSPGGYVYNGYIQKFKCEGNPYPSIIEHHTISPELQEYVKKQLCEIYKDCK